ncbi:MAG: tetratricopeptide repeat protein [Gemmataceae bacterium]
MDCRRPLVVWLGVLTLAAGCTHPVAGLRTKPAVAKDVASEPTTHQAATYVAFGDFRASSAYSAETPPAMQQQLREDARLSYLKAMEVNPKYVPAYLALARLQQRAEDYTAAIATYQKAVTIDPNDSNLWYELGMCQCRQKKWIDAVVHLRKAIELGPDNGAYRKTLGYTLGRAGRLEESLQVLTEAEGEARANYDLARMLHHMNQTDQARQYTTRAAQLDPSLPGLQTFVALLDGKPAPVDAAVQTTSFQPAPGQPEQPQEPGPLVLPPIDKGEFPTINGATTPKKPLRLPPLPVVRKPGSGN